MNEVKFKFDEPRHGWMDIRISDNDKSISLDISDMPCDSINQLADVLLGIQSGVRIQEVEFSLEPEYARWRFQIEGENLTVQVFESIEQSEPVLFSDTSEKIAWSMYQSLRDLESLQCRKEFEDQSINWSWEFPSLKLNEFYGRENRA